jgi:inosine-uridine nucleoside N-ribohydrolase
LVAPVIDIINTYYGRQHLPVGAPKGTGGLDMTTPLQWPEEIVQQYPHDVQSTADVPDAVTVYRQILAQQPDTSVTIVTVGFLTNLANLLQSGADTISELGGSGLVEKKVKRLVSMAGAFPEGKEFNVEMDSAASLYVAEHWPAPIIFSGFEIGNKVLTGAELVQKGSQGNPVRHMYALALEKEGADNRMSWDQTAVLVAARGTEPYYDLRRGKIQVKADGSNTWQDDPQGQHYYLVEKMNVAAVRDTIETLMMYEPE